VEPGEHHWGDHQSASRRPNKALDTVEEDMSGSRQSSCGGAGMAPPQDWRLTRGSWLEVSPNA
jgi:hypothetical protein